LQARIALRQERQIVGGEKSEKPHFWGVTVYTQSLVVLIELFLERSQQII
jgi:hypothetical protein